MHTQIQFESSFLWTLCHYYAADMCIHSRQLLCTRFMIKHVFMHLLTHEQTLLCPQCSVHGCKIVSTQCVLTTIGLGHRSTSTRPGPSTLAASQLCVHTQNKYTHPSLSTGQPIHRYVYTPIYAYTHLCVYFDMHRSIWDTRPAYS